MKKGPIKLKLPELREAVKEGMEVQIDFPKCVRIELVQANELRHYEIFMWLGSLFATSTAGFWTAYCTTVTNGALFWISWVFTGFTVAFGLTAFYFRNKLKTGKITKTVPI